MSVDATANVQNAAPQSKGKAHDTVAAGPAGFGLSYNLEIGGDGYAKGKVDPMHIQRAITQALGGKPGIESLAKDIMKKDADIHKPARTLQGMKSVQARNTGPVKKQLATDSFAPKLFGETVAQQEGTKARIEEILALQHQEMKISVVHVNAKTAEAQEILDGVKPTGVQQSTSQKAATNGTKPRNWAGLESHRPSPWTG